MAEFVKMALKGGKDRQRAWTLWRNWWRRAL